MDNSDMTREDKVQEGEVISTDLDTQDSSTSQATILENLESLIRENFSKISKLQKELKTQKDELASVLDNDQVYKQHQEAVKTATKVRNSTRQEILKRPDVSHVAEKVKGLTAEIKEAKESLNSYLPEYQRLSGLDQIEDEAGEALQIVYSARLVRRKS